MSDEQEKKTEASTGAAVASSSSDRPAPGPSTLGGLGDLLKASQAGELPGGAPVIGGLAALAGSESAPPPAAPASPFDQKVGGASSQYTFVMNSADLKDLIGDPSKQQVSVHSAASAGYESGPKVAKSEPPSPDLEPAVARRPVTRDLPPPPRAPSRASSRAPVVKTRAETSSRPMVLAAIVVLLLLVFLLLRRNAALEQGLSPSPVAPEVGASSKE